MATSPLDFKSQDQFRIVCLKRNLKPYNKSPRKLTPPVNYEYQRTEFSVVDSPDQLIDNPTLANKLYPLNQWGAEGGYKQVPDPGALLNSKSNKGEYGPGQQDAKILEQALPKSKDWKKINPYSNGSEGISDSAEGLVKLEYPEYGTKIFNNQPYYQFVSSFYSPANILLSNDPTGSDGFLSQDSYIAQLGARRLRKSFQDRIATNIRRNTLNRANAYNGNNSNNATNQITSTIPLLAPSYQITVPSNPTLAATDFALRLAGSIIPTSTIPGSYFDPSINPGQPTTIQQLQNAFRSSNTGVGNFFSQLLGGSKAGSEVFLENTGTGQKSILFNNLNYNKFKPNYDRPGFNRLLGEVVASVTNNSNFYIGSIVSDPSRILSPGGDIPVDAFGREVEAPVYGPSEIAQIYEGSSREIRLGANAPSYVNGGGIEGGMTWVSPKYKGNAGKKVGIGGEITDQDEDFKPSSYNSSESTELVFREGSILDDTQRLINSQPRGGRRLQHVGNAIDQVSKVFNDGYTEMTKGSRVLSYVGDIGQEVGTEYCRVFAKDLPYLQYNDLQKTDGITTEGRRFAYSVLDKTYNLNMYPNKPEGGQDSSNLVVDSANNTGYAKKYMFSLENLAWRTSNTPGFNVSELPLCERGPNGGRIMWFPPYDLKFTESVTANWKGNDFLGRPEQIYTYTNTTRTGTLSWKIVVDHPSVLNVIVNKVLNNETKKTRINSLLNSFFAGCLKYDLYELAKKYYTISPNELADLQQAISSKDLSREQLNFAKNTLATGNDSTGNQASDVTQASTTTPSQNFDKFVNFSMFFPVNYPISSDVQDYSVYRNIYIALTQQGLSYSSSTGKTFVNNAVITNSSQIENQLINEIKTYLSNNVNSKIVITLMGSAAQGASEENLKLSDRRIESAIKYFQANTDLNKYIKEQRLIFTPVQSGQNSNIEVYNGTSFKSESYDTCSNNDDSTNNSPYLYSLTASACRRVKIQSIVATTQVPNIPTSQPSQQTNGNRQGTVPINTVPTNELETKVRKTDNITKRVVRALISECDYFETIKEETPMVYDNLRDKLKFFQPAFHSTTPEGLNSRLTFLHQCTRPGDTIPIVKQVDGSSQLVYNDATNTAFGLPPVLVLRVGDFFNTKIIPTSLSLTHEGLDLNPEGIGIQPMICTVSLNFNFIGGSGIKDAVDKLQNALTFNYYANTEIWDDRADVTDDSLKVLDKEFLNLINQSGPPTANQVSDFNSQSNQNPIGTIISRTVDTTGDYGTISYQDFMDKYVQATQTYFQTIVNKSKDCLKQYNNGMLQQWTTDRIYKDGKMEINNTSTTTQLFGKPDSLQKNIDNLFEAYLKNIESDQDEFLIFMNLPSWNFSSKVKRELKKNYKNYVKNKKSSFLNPITKIIQDTTQFQQTFLGYLGRNNVICNQQTTSTGGDGYQEKNGNVKVILFSGTTGVSAGFTPPNTVEELAADSQKVAANIQDYYTLLGSKTDFNYNSTKYEGKLLYDKTEVNTKSVFVPFSSNQLFKKEEFRRQYFIMSQDIKSDKYETFKNAIIGNIVGNDKLIANGSGEVSQKFDAYWKDKARPIFEEEDNIASSFLENLEKTKLKDYIKYTPFPSKTRIMDFRIITTADPKQIEYIKGLGITTNINNSKQTWNDLKSNALVSKVKLN